MDSGTSADRSHCAAECEELRRQASELVDGCEETTRVVLEEHLHQCGDCDLWFDTLKSTVDLLRTLPRPIVQEDLLTRLKALRPTD